MIARALRASAPDSDPDYDNYVAHTLRGEGFDASEDGTCRGTPLVSAFHGTQDPIVSGQITPTLGTTGRGREACMSFDTTHVTSKTNRSNPKPGDPCHTLSATAHTPALSARGGIRRITPLEAERLQGFPDLYTKVKGSSDSARYKAIGNSMAVPVMAWIGRRIQVVEGLWESTAHLRG